MKFKSLLLLTLLTTACFGETVTIQSEANKLMVLRPSKPSAILVQEPLGLQYESFLLSSEEQVVVFHTQTFKRIVLTAFCNGEQLPIVTQYVVNVGNAPPTPPEPNPTPPRPDPDKPLSTVATYVRDTARSAGITPTVGNALATNYETVSSMLAAVSSMSVEQAKVKLLELNRSTTQKYPLPRAAKELEDKLVKYCNDVGTDTTKLGLIFDEIAIGFKAL